MRSNNTQAPGARSRSALARLPLAVAIHLAVCGSAFAQTAAPAADPADDEAAPALATVSVTAQKREENQQVVPISMLVLGPDKLDELNINDFKDFARMLPSVSFEQGAPGFAQVYMRGVASGSNGNHSGPLPSVGQYLDEQPITTIQGALDVHVYDVARVEALAGPQGTLYGASSQSGTLRIITNKPDPSLYMSGFGVEVNSIAGGGMGHVAEGYVNAPINESAAIRLVGWNKKDAGYIDNVLSERTYPVSGITVDNAEHAGDNYNDTYTTGVRAALGFNIDDSWTITPTIMGQRQKGYGSFGYEQELGDLEVARYFPESSDDLWRQAALTVQGKLGNFDVTYAFAHLKRGVDSESDYSDYSFWYDTLYGSGAYLYDNAGVLVDPSQYIQGIDRYTKRSHEFRIASPADERFRAVAGVFWMQQNHDIQQRYRIDNIADAISVTGWEGTIWLTKQVRRDHDEAIFGELSYDITDDVTLTGGARFFKAENGLEGFFGYSAGYSSRTGEAACFDETDFHGAPCINVDKVTRENDSLGRVNLTWQVNEGTMVYATWSEGYRPGGINRRGTLPPYSSDFLTNYELGWKFLTDDSRLLLNGAVFEEEWKDFQFAILGANGLTEIKNANQARIRGAEVELSWAATYNLTLSGGAAFYDAELTENYCGFTDLEGNPISFCPAGTINPQTGDPVDGPEAPAGTQLPVTARFKGNLTARYAFDLGEFDSFLQGSLVHEGDRYSDLRLADREITGKLDAYEMVDLSAGVSLDAWSMEFFIRNVTDERAENARSTQCTVCLQNYTFVAQPRTFGVRFGYEF